MATLFSSFVYMQLWGFSGLYCLGIFIVDY